MKRHIFAAVLLGLMFVARPLPAHETSPSSELTEEPSIALAAEVDRCYGTLSVLGERTTPRL